MRRPTSVLLTLQLALAPACKKDEAAAEAAATTPTEAKDGAAPSSGSAASLPTTPSYPAGLDALLDLVPADVSSYMIVRDPGAFVHGATWLVEAERAPIDGFMGLVSRKDPKADRGEQVRKFLDNYGAFVAALTGGVQLERGAVVYQHDDAGVVLFHATDPDALKKALAVIGIESKAEFQCKAVAEPSGVVACSELPAAITGFASGKAASKRREELAKAIPGTDLERANLIGIAGDAEKVVWTVESMPGRLELGVQFAGVPAEARRFAAAGPASALEAVSPGATFVWGRVDMAALEPMIASVPSPFQNVVKSLTGEYLIGATEDPIALVVLAGATDPAPFRGAMAMMMLGMGEGKKELPDGGTLEVKLENVDVGGSPTQVVHATAAGRPEIAQMTDLGMQPEAFAFAGGRWIAATLGADAKIVDKIAGLAGAGPSDALLATLPPGLAGSLRDGKTAFAIHLALDGLHTAATRQAFDRAFAAMPKTGDAPNAEDLRHFMGLLAPISSMSVWMTWNEIGPQAHLALQGFSDPSTDAGKAAQAALLEVGKGGDPAAVYGALATKFADAPRAASYRVRAGETANSMMSSMSSVMLVGILAAVAIPAFTKYIERSKAAAGGK